MRSCIHSPRVPVRNPPPAVEGAGGAFGQQTRRKDEPQGRQGDAVAEDVFGRAAHAQRLGPQSLTPCQRHARKDEKQQQVHREVEERLVFETRCEVLEKDVSLQRDIAESQVGDRLDPADRDKQEPPESQRHVHVAQHGVDPEDAAVQQRFAEDFADGPEGRARGQAAQNQHLVGAGQPQEPYEPLAQHDGEHGRGADDERQAERCVELHGQRSPNLCLISMTTPRVLMPRGQTSRHLPHSMHLFISS